MEHGAPWARKKAEEESQAAKAEKEEKEKKKDQDEQEEEDEMKTEEVLVTDPLREGEPGQGGREAPIQASGLPELQVLAQPGFATEGQASGSTQSATGGKGAPAEFAREPGAAHHDHERRISKGSIWGILKVVQL